MAYFLSIYSYTFLSVVYVADLWAQSHKKTCKRFAGDGGRGGHCGVRVGSKVDSLATVEERKILD